MPDQATVDWLTTRMSFVGYPLWTGSPPGRPDWERAGARFVEDIGPWERRKLYLLNGAHSLLAYAGQVRGHETVAQAFADPICARAVEHWWDEVSVLLVMDGLDAYREHLRSRFANPAIHHYLRQIAEDAVPKLRARVAEAEIDPRLPDRTDLLNAIRTAHRELRERP